MLTEVEAGRADQVANVFDKQDVDVGQVQSMQRVVHHVRVQVAGAAGRDLDRRDALGADALGIILGLQVALDHGDAQFSLERLDRCLQQAGLAGARRRHQVDGEHAVAVEMFAVVQRLMIVLAEQVLQNLDRGAAVGGLPMLAVGPDQVFVARGNVTAAGVAHDRLREMASKVWAGVIDAWLN